jgi:hypothetical protein
VHKEQHALNKENDKKKNKPKQQEVIQGREDNGQEILFFEIDEPLEDDTIPSQKQ